MRIQKNRNVGTTHIINQAMDFKEDNKIFNDQK